MAGKVSVGNVVFGEGRPKICVPIVAETKEEIFAQAERVRTLPADLVEWRADWFLQVTDEEALNQVLAGLHNLLDALPLLFTFRTKAEGGAADVSPADYVRLCKIAALSGIVSLVDVELFLGNVFVRDLVAFLKARGVKTVLSSHDFEKTPPKEEILRRLLSMEALGADLAKIAVMPQNGDDVLTLLSATLEANRRLSCPVITMSMGKLGVISRLAGETFGSCLTFGSAAQASAPGQIEVTQLSEILNLLRQS